MDLTTSAEKATESPQVPSDAQMSGRFKIAKRLEAFSKIENIWVMYSALAIKHNALNLGQGFPDYPPPKSVTDALAAAANSSNPLMHQYTRGYGHPRLVNALAKLYTTELQHPVDPMRNVLISNGGYMCLYSAIHSLVDEGDEVVILEPFFDCYEPMVRSAGGHPVFVPLRPPTNRPATELRRSAQDWRWDEDQLRSAFTPRTKMLIMNTPNNPVGKVLDAGELQTLAELCCRHDVICLSDEVYEWLVYPGNRHLRIASLPGMRERTLTIGSAGKTFSATGWKLGWSIGPEELIAHLQVVHRNSCYTCPTPTQEAVGAALESELSRRGTPAGCYLDDLPKELLPKRDRLARLVEEAGLPVYLPAGGYFMIVDISSLPEPPPPPAGTPAVSEPRDARLVRWLTSEHRLATIPCSCFYGETDKPLGENFIRLCFIKRDETIEQFGEGLKRWLKPEKNLEERI